MAQKTLDSVKKNWTLPEKWILGAGCGATVNFADIKEGEIVVDLGPGSGIDVFLYANNVKESGTAIDIDLTYEMLQRAKNIAQQAGYSNVEFRRAISLDNWLLDQSLLDRQGNRNSASAILRLQI